MAQLGLEDAAALFLLRACSSWQVTHWHTVGEIAQGVLWLKQRLSVLQCCAALGHICSTSSPPCTAMPIPLS